MFNLVVICWSGYCEDCSPILDSQEPVRIDGPGRRLFDYTSGELIERFAPDVSKLASLPTLISAEGDSPVVLGKIASLELGDRIVSERGRTTYKEIVSFEFQRKLGDISVGEILESERLKDLDLDVHFTRCHWAVIDGNIVEAVWETMNRVGKKRLDASRPRIFNVREWPVPARKQVAVMMPFKTELDATHDAIKAACESQSMKAIRVDERYRPVAIIDDIFETIAQSGLVICDFTDKNANVMYEAGIAHTLNKDVIILTQNQDDVPFDLRHRRFIQYSPNPQGLRVLKEKLSLAIRETFQQEAQNSARSIW